MHGILLCWSLLTFAQFNVGFRVIDVPPNHPGDSVFVGGSFNGWAPADIGNPVLTLNKPVFIELKNIPAGEYRYKFTRGNWLAVECQANGKDIDNRVLNLSSDTVINISIEGWKDDFETFVKRHTASPHVQVMDTAFFMPQLGRTRRIWLYLPPGYSKTKKRYPVIYMQDGQNIFDEYTAAFGEWRVDECADSMIKKGLPACIIVGIDNGPKRLNEYNPYRFNDVGEGEGDLYVEFLAETLKPFVDKNYRTLKGNENTIIAGSSMGGLIAYYAMLKYPGVFGKGGIFSPAFWTAGEIKKLTELKGDNLQGTLFFYMGGLEGAQYIEDMNDVTEKLGQNSIALIYTVIDPEGSHNEQAWRKWFPEFYKWVLASGFNNIITVEEH